jgi:D-alanine-D-alanine ligase
MADDAIIFPVIHGEFGEDGGLQTLLERAGLPFVGSGSWSSALCMDKCRTKELVAAAGLRVADGIKIVGGRMPSPADLVASLGTSLVFKPNAKGSSLGVRPISSVEGLAAAMESSNDGEEYVLERKIDGIDLSVGILDGRALEVVEIRPKGEFFNYADKYIPGTADEFCPARLPPSTVRLVRDWGETAFRICRCRDWARMDAMLDGDGQLFFLEINTIPGMTANSMYPRSAAATGLDWRALVGKLVSLAIARQVG